MSPLHVITPAEALEDAERRGMPATADFWRDHQNLMGRLQVGAEFWSDAVAKLKREGKHLEAAVICRDAKPVPAAYRDLLICLRKLFKDSDRQGALLRELYATAVEATVLHRQRYIEYTVNGRKTGCPGFNAAAILFKDFQERSRDIRYAEVGIDHVEWLNKTDRGRLVKAWGEPDAHQDPFELFKEDWDRAVGTWIRGQGAGQREFEKSMSELLSGTPSRPKRRKRLFGLFG